MGRTKKQIYFTTGKMMKQMTALAALALVGAQADGIDFGSLVDVNGDFSNEKSSSDGGRRLDGINLGGLTDMNGGFDNSNTSSDGGRRLDGINLGGLTDMNGSFDNSNTSS